ncbi:MAG: hypothetical protein JSV26_09100 [bacterium]|nr:MAG: hypothetical protein JSV26_09100 [bacterium]
MSRADLKRWVSVPNGLYQGSPYYVPQLFSDQLTYFDRHKNPAFEICDVELFLAVDNGRLVGRVCAIVNGLEAEKLGYRRGRFGWFECVDDQGVADRLLDSVKNWCGDLGCTEMTGPQGFTDLDVEGLLIEGFDALPTISGSYNHPYYRKLLENYGFEKDIDYVEFRCRIPQESQLLERFRRRYAGSEDYRVVTCKSRRELFSHADAFWRVLEACFEPLYGVTPLSRKQTEFYTKKYFGFLDPNFAKLTFSRQGELVGFFIGMPNLSRSFKRANGRLLPFGLPHILREYRKPDTVDFLLAGVKPGEPSGLITAISAVAMYDTVRRRGVRHMETNRELEDNTTVTGIWSKFERTWFRRSRVYRMDLP